jgi:hypothetical protein
MVDGPSTPPTVRLAIAEEPTQPPSPQTVPVGVASYTGYGVAIAGLIGAVLAYVTGDQSQAQLGSIVGATVGLISLAVTQIGRYVQANSQIKTSVEMKRLEAEGKSMLGALERSDPQAIAQLEEVVRGVLRDEINRLPGGTAQAVATDVANIVLPSPEEEAAAQPPAASHLGVGGT